MSHIPGQLVTLHLIISVLHLRSQSRPPFCGDGLSHFLFRDLKLSPHVWLHCPHASQSPKSPSIGAPIIKQTVGRLIFWYLQFILRIVTYVFRYNIKWFSSYTWALMLIARNPFMLKSYAFITSILRSRVITTSEYQLGSIATRLVTFFGVPIAPVSINCRVLHQVSKSI